MIGEASGSTSRASPSISSAISMASTPRWGGRARRPAAGAVGLGDDPGLLPAAQRRGGPADPACPLARGELLAHPGSREGNGGSLASDEVLPPSAGTARSFSPGRL